MPDRDRPARERWLLCWELAELHARLEAADSSARRWRREARVILEEARRATDRTRCLVGGCQAPIAR